MLLERDPAKRIGGFDNNRNTITGEHDLNKDDAHDIRKHVFFKDIDWEAVKYRQHKAAFKPKVDSKLDLKCIDKVFLQEGL